MKKALVESRETPASEKTKSDVLQTGGSELRRGKRKEEEEEGREVGGPLFSSLFFLFSLPTSLVGTSSRLRIAANLHPPGG